MHASDRVIPADVVIHHIFPSLPAFSLVCARMVCQKWMKFIPLPKRYRSDEILASLFENGAPMELTLWFENILLFPVWNSAAEHYESCERNLLLAAKGMDEDMDVVIIILKNFL
jgi:hypothetical protein